MEPYDKKRIAEFVRVLDRGGIESFIINNIKKMDRTNLTIDFLLMRNQEEAYDEEIRLLNCNKRVIFANENSGKVALTINYFISFLNFFARHKYDVVHFHAIPPGIMWASILLAAKLTGTKRMILHSHMGTPTYDIKGLKRIKWIIGRKITSCLADELIACSDMAAEFAFSPSEIKTKGFNIIKNGIDTSVFAYNEIIRKKSREFMGISGKFVIGCVARFAGFKNHKFMIEILEELLQIRNDVVLVMVGGVVEGEERVLDELVKTINARNLSEHVLLLGETQRPEEIYNALDVYLMPSFREGFSISGVEAQCSGLKVVASDRISKMMKLTDNWISVPLEYGAEKWAEIVSECGKNYIRKEYSAEIKNAGYDTGDTAKVLENLYRL